VNQWGRITLKSSEAHKSGQQLPRPSRVERSRVLAKSPATGGSTKTCHWHSGADSWRANSAAPDRCIYLSSLWPVLRTPVCGSEMNSAGANYKPNIRFVGIFPLAQLANENANME